jgi:hypothetical protein
VKRCGGGATPRVITNESPATPVEPRRRGRLEPEGLLEEESEIESRMNGSASATSSARATDTLAPATTVRAVNARMLGSALHIFVETDGATQFKDFVLTNPSRVVIDIAGVRNAIGNKLLPVPSRLVDRVRVGEPTQGVVRIVVDVKTIMRYRVTQDGASLVIIIGDGSVASRTDALRTTSNH